LVLLLGGLTVACSDLGEESVSPAEVPLTETVTGPETTPPSTNREGGYYADTDDLQISMDAYLTTLYKNVKYPAAARKSGTTGKFRARMRLGLNGKIETLDILPFTNERAGGPPAAQEIVVVGQTAGDVKGKKVPEALTAEIDRVLHESDNFTRLLIDGVPTKQTMNVDFTFKLEE